jgi:NAD(P)-dependent dehydrogenase (short-subunit alcohol dehydrogenase family)
MPASKTSELDTGRVALVTGAAYGIGQAMAAGLAERGTRIVLGDIDEVSEASDPIGATGHRAFPVTPDVSDPSSIEAAHDRVTDPPGRVELQNVRPGKPVSRSPLDVTRRPQNAGLCGKPVREPTAK